MEYIMSVFNVISKLNPIILLLVLGISILAFKYKFILLRNNKNKIVYVLKVLDTNRLLVKNVYYFLIKIETWKKFFKNEKIVKYMENEREICLIAIPNGKYINDKRKENRLKDILKKYVNQQVKIKYKTNRSKELSLFQKLILMRDYKGFSEKIKYFLNMFTFNYDYYFSVRLKKEELSKKIIEETGIWDDSGEFSYLRHYQYQSVINKAKENIRNKKYENLYKQKLKAVYADEIINEELEK